MAIKRTFSSLILNFFNWTWFWVKVTCLFIVLIIIVPFEVPSILLCSLFRRFVFKTAKYFNSDLGKILTTRSALFASDRIYSKPLCNVVGLKTAGSDWCQKGIPADIKKYRQMVTDEWINKRDPKTGDLLYPEITQYVTNWFGYRFWRNEPNFNVDQHVFIWDGGKRSKNECVDQKEAEAYIEKLLETPYPPKTSPWQFIIIPNYRENPNITHKIKGYDPTETHLAILNWHHCLMDGFGAFRLLSELVDVYSAAGKVTEKQQDVVDEKNYGSGDNAAKRKEAGVLDALSFCLRAPWSLCKMYVESRDPIRENSWHLPDYQLKRRWVQRLSDHVIDNSLIKEIKNHFGVSYTAVTFAAVADSMRNFMQTAQPGRKIPEFIHIGLPFPMKTTEKLRNSMSMCTLKLPVGGDSSAVDRLMYIEKKVTALKTEITPAVAYTLMPIVGSLFNFLIRLIIRNQNTTAIVSIMPGPPKLGNSSDEILHPGSSFAIAPGPGNTGFTMSSFSFMDQTRIGATVDLALIKDPNQVDLLVNGVLSHLKTLKSLIKSEV